jgi:hypothetical protein
VIALIRGEQMDNDISVIHHHPALASLALLAAFLAVPGADGIERALRERIQHAVTRAATEHEIIGKGSHVFYVEQENVFAFFVFQRINDSMSQFECVQKSPHEHK